MADNPTPQTPSLTVVQGQGQTSTRSPAGRKKSDASQTYEHQRATFRDLRRQQVAYCAGDWYQFSRTDGWRKLDPHVFGLKLRRSLAKVLGDGDNKHPLDGIPHTLVNKIEREAPNPLQLGGEAFAEWVMNNRGEAAVWNPGYSEDAGSWDFDPAKIPLLIQGSPWKNGFLQIQGEQQNTRLKFIDNRNEGIVWSPRYPLPYTWNSPNELQAGRDRGELPEHVTPSWLALGGWKTHYYPEWFMGVLDDWGLHDIADFVMALIGMTLCEHAGATQKMIYLYGIGGSGKSTFLDLMVELCGGHMGCMSISTPMDLDSRFQTAELESRRLLVIQESGKMIDEPGYERVLKKLKNITAGGGQQVERKGQTPYSSNLKCSVWAAGNEKPSWATTLENADAWARRLIVLHMNQTQVDPNTRVAWLHKKVVEAEGQKIAHYACYAYVEWLRKGNPIPERVADVIEEAALHDLDPVSAWLREAVKKDKSSRVSRDDFLDSFRRSPFATNAVSDRKLMARLCSLEQGGVRRRSNNTTYIEGLRLEEPSEYAEYEQEDKERKATKSGKSGKKTREDAGSNEDSKAITKDDLAEMQENAMKAFAEAAAAKEKDEQGSS